MDEHESEASGRANGRETSPRGIAYWQKQGHEAIFAEAWRLVVEAELATGKTLSEIRMDRSVTRLVRRGWHH